MGDEALQKGQELLQAARDIGIDKTKRAVKFMRAAQVFKEGEHWQQAAEAYCESAKLRESLGSHNVPTCYEEAANCYRKVNTQKALECLERVIVIHTKRKSYSNAAQTHLTVGEIYEETGVSQTGVSQTGVSQTGESQTGVSQTGESQTGKSQLAAENFKKAAYYYSKAKDVKANECSARAAHLFADIGKFDKAASLFKELGKTAVEQGEKDVAQDHILKACLCLMNEDVPKCKKALQKFATLSPSFTNSCKYQLLQELVAAANPKKPNPEAFKKAVDEYCETSKPESWTKRLLNSLKQLKGGK